MATLQNAKEALAKPTKYQPRTKDCWRFSRVYGQRAQTRPKVPDRMVVRPLLATSFLAFCRVGCLL